MFLKRIRFFILLGLVASSQAQCSAARSLGTQSDFQNVHAGNSFSYFHFLLGELEGLGGNNELALEHYLVAGQFDTTSSTIRLKQAEQMLGLSRVTEAKRLLEGIKDLDTPEFYLLSGRVSALEMDLDTAVVSIDRALTLYEKQKDPSKIRETILMKVALLSDSRRFKDAIKTLQSFLRNEPDDEIAYYFLGKIYSMIEEKEKSKAAYSKALELRPQFATAAKALGLQYEVEGNLPNAIQTYQQALKSAQADLPLRQKLANLFLATENFAGALEHLRFLASADPEDLYLQLKTALVHFKLEQFEEAEGILKRLVGKQNISQDRVNFYLAALYEERGNFELAANHYKKVGLESEYFLDSRIQMAFLYGEKLHKFDRVPAVFNEAINQRPSMKELYLGLASFYESQNNLSNAILTMSRANEKIQGDEAVLFALGTYLDKHGQSDEGIIRMKEVLAINPNHAHAMNHIGYVYAEKKVNLGEAEKLLLKAVQIEPNNAFIVDSLGWLYHQKGDFKKAKEVLEKAVQLKKDEGIIMEHLADVYFKLGLHDLALKMYQQVVNVSSDEQVPSGPDQERRQRIRQKIAGLERNPF